MSATTAHAHHAARATDARTTAPRRRRTIVVSVLLGLLGVYLLGVAWFADTLSEDMARSFQVAPAVADVEHR